MVIWLAVFALVLGTIWLLLCWVNPYTPPQPLHWIGRDLITPAERLRGKQLPGPVSRR